MKNLLDLLWKNKLYVILVLFLSFLFVTSRLSVTALEEKKLAEEQTVRVQEKLKEAQSLFEQAVKDKGDLEKYLLAHPKEMTLLNSLALFIVTLFLYGLWLDVGIFLRRRRGEPVLERLEFIAAPRWSIGDVFRVMILFLAISAGLGWVGDLARPIAPQVFNDNGLMILHSTLADLVALGLVLYFSRFKYDQPFFKNQIRTENLWKDAWLGVNAYVALFPIVVGLLLTLIWVMSLFHYEPPPQKLVEVFIEEGERNPILIGYSILLASFIGPAIEEIFFRGFFYSALRKKWSAVPSALITAAFFALLHQSVFAFLPVFVLSLFLTYLYEKRKSLVAPIVFHWFHNSLFLGYFFLMKANFLDKFLR